MRSIVRWVMIAILITLALEAGLSPAAAQTGPARTDTLRVDLAEVVRIAPERSAVRRRVPARVPAQAVAARSRRQTRDARE